jgi:hypothetical protein
VPNRPKFFNRNTAPIHGCGQRTLPARALARTRSYLLSRSGKALGGTRCGFTARSRLVARFAIAGLRRNPNPDTNQCQPNDNNQQVSPKPFRYASGHSHVLRHSILYRLEAGQI